jgi:D-psicose/D-tagatose/L-ribulose 3-epimerase
VLTTCADAMALCKQVDHPAVGVLYDTFHANIEEKDAVKSLESLGKYLYHVHISENDRGTPGSGHVPWDATFAMLRKMNYQGWLTIEAFGRAMPEIAAATRVWRDFYQSPDEACVEGYKFLKKMLG